MSDKNMFFNPMFEHLPSTLLQKNTLKNSHTSVLFSFQFFQCMYYGYRNECCTYKAVLMIFTFRLKEVTDQQPTLD